MALTLEDALNSYGFVGTMANAIPDLKGIFDQAVKAEWVPAQFTRAVEDSNWWKQNAESVRQVVKLQTTDPATYQQNYDNATSKITLMAAQQGRIVDYRGLAMQAMLGNWDDEQINAQIGTVGKLAHGDSGALYANAAQINTHLTELATNYGVPATKSWLDFMTTQIQSGKDTMDGMEAVMRARAKAAFPQLAKQIDAGMTVRDVADPYIASYAQTLEVAESAVKLNDPAVMKALQMRDDKGNPTTKPMWQFVRELKDDPRYDKTVGARKEAYSVLNKIGSDFGFLGD